MFWLHREAMLVYKFQILGGTASSKNVGILQATHVLLQFPQPRPKFDCFFVSIYHEVNIFGAIEI